MSQNNEQLKAVLTQSGLISAEVISQLEKEALNKKTSFESLLIEKIFSERSRWLNLSLT